MWRLPVAPRPYPDELLSSWLGRVACRYGLRAAELAGRFSGPGALDLRPAPIDDMAPGAGETARWARICRVDPERLRRLALTRRYPDRPRSWFGREGPGWRPSPGSPPACLASFDADRACGRDACLRADWTLAERCVCSLHRRLLSDRCPHGCGRLQVGFRFRDGRARPICARCGRDLAGGAGQGGRPQDLAVIEAVLRVERRIADRVDTGRSLGLEFGDRRAVGAARSPRGRTPGPGVVVRGGRLAMSFRGPACGRRGCAAGRTADFLAGRDLGGPQGRLRRGAEHRRRDPGGGSPRPAGGPTSSRFGSPGGAERARGSSARALGGRLPASGARDPRPPGVDRGGRAAEAEGRARPGRPD